MILGLLYFEQVEILYVISVLGLSGFLLVVAFSRLDRGHVKSDASTQDESEAAAVAVGAATIPSPAAPRRTAQRRRKGAA